MILGYNPKISFHKFTQCIISFLDMLFTLTLYYLQK